MLYSLIMLALLAAIYWVAKKQKPPWHMVQITRSAYIGPWVKGKQCEQCYCVWLTSKRDHKPCHKCGGIINYTFVGREIQVNGNKYIQRGPNLRLGDDSCYYSAESWYNIDNSVIVPPMRFKGLLLLTNGIGYTIE